jgi:hypothetical protein
MCGSHFPKISMRMPATCQARHRSMPFAQHSRLSVHTRPRLPTGMRQYGRAGKRGVGSSSAASGDSSSSDAALHRPCRSTQRRTSSGLVRVCSRRRTRTAPRVAAGSSLVSGLRGRRGDRIHRGLFRGGVPGFGQSPAGRCSTSALWGTGPDVPRPGLAPASAHRQNRMRRPGRWGWPAPGGVAGLRGVDGRYSAG